MPYFEDGWIKSDVPFTLMVNITDTVSREQHSVVTNIRPEQYSINQLTFLLQQSVDEFTTQHRITPHQTLVNWVLFAEPIPAARVEELSWTQTMLANLREVFTGV